jgi:hypothetical protein
MAENNAKSTSLRFIVPTAILTMGLALIRMDVSITLLTPHEITTLGVSFFALGAFSFVILINDARNEILNTDDKVAITHVLVIYAAIMTMATYENILAIKIVTFTICVIMGLGIFAALLANNSGVKRFEVSS